MGIEKLELPLYAHTPNCSLAKNGHYFHHLHVAIDGTHRKTNHSYLTLEQTFSYSKNPSLPFCKTTSLEFSKLNARP